MTQKLYKVFELLEKLITCDSKTCHWYFVI